MLSNCILLISSHLYSSFTLLQQKIHGKANISKSKSSWKDQELCIVYCLEDLTRFFSYYSNKYLLENIDDGSGSINRRQPSWKILLQNKEGMIYN
jgi:hypothetical protein